MGLTFFGLTPSYRNIVFAQIHDLVYHGGGGFIHSEVYNMPIWLRRYHIQQLNQYFKDQEKAMKKAQQSTPKESVTRPNINPSTSYNI